MKKIQSLFKRDYEGTRQVYNEVVPGSEWVINGEGEATLKFDGTSCAIIDGELYKRYDVKKGRSVPEGAIPCEESRNEHTGHWPHWVKCDRDNPEDKYHFEALDRLIKQENNQNWPLNLLNGTYELCGPKVNGNKEKLDNHFLFQHGSVGFNNFPRDFDSIKEWLSNNEIEGVVWHHPDGRMVKIKRKDFGFKW